MTSTAALCWRPDPRPRRSWSPVVAQRGGTHAFRQASTRQGRGGVSDPGRRHLPIHAAPARAPGAAIATASSAPPSRGKGRFSGTTRHRSRLHPYKSPHGSLRPDRHRQRPRRRVACAAAGPHRQAHPDPGARRLSAAHREELELASGVRRRRSTRPRKTGPTPKGDKFSPALHYYVGGNSKVYGAALFRLRERDFGEVVHAGGISPAWPLGYDVFEPYYSAGGKTVSRAWSARRRPARAMGQRPVSASAGQPRAEDCRAVGQPARHRAEPVSSAAGHPAGRKAGRQADPHQHLHALQLFRRLSVPAERQGGRAGDLHRSDAGRASERHSADRCLRLEARDRCDGPQGGCGARHAQRAGRGVLGRHRGGGLRRAVVGAAAAALGQRPASERPRKRLGPGRPQLHAARHERS